MVLVKLRPTTYSDLDFVLATEQHEDNCPFIFQWTRQQHEATFADPNVAHLIIECAEKQVAVGYVILAGLTDANQSIALQRIVVAQKAQGYGKEALKMIQKLAFETLKMHRLWLDVKADNLRARRVYESVGFVVEGTLRECLKTGDRFESLIVMSMLEDEYRG